MVPFIFIVCTDQRIIRTIEGNETYLGEGTEHTFGSEAALIPTAVFGIFVRVQAVGRVVPVGEDLPDIQLSGWSRILT